MQVLSRTHHIPFLSKERENLLEKFPILDRVKRESLEQIVKDLWIIVSHDYEQLKLYMEPQGLWAD